MSDVEKVPAPGFDPVTCPYCGDKWSLPGCSGHCYGSPDPARPDEWNAAIEAAANGLRKRGFGIAAGAASSPMYYLGGRVETLADVEARNDPKEEILRSNMRRNGVERIIVNDNSWRFTAALEPDDVVLEYKP